MVDSGSTNSDKSCSLGRRMTPSEMKSGFEMIVYRSRKESEIASSR